MTCNFCGHHFPPKAPWKCSCECHPVYAQGQRDMRERAAKVAEELFEPDMVAPMAAQIRALREEK